MTTTTTATETAEFTAAVAALRAAEDEYDALLPTYRTAEAKARRSRTAKNVDAYRALVAQLEETAERCHAAQDVLERTPQYVEVEVAPEGVQLALV